VVTLACPDRPPPNVAKLSPYGARHLAFQVGMIGPDIRRRRGFPVAARAARVSVIFARAENRDRRAVGESKADQSKTHPAEHVMLF
jgi:hypothetical protein